MDRPRRRLSELTSEELSRRAIEYRRMAMTAIGQATILALNKLAVRFALLAARREIEEAASPSPDQDQSELDKLIQLAEQAAADEPDPVQALADIIKTVSESGADPYLIMGVLVEGAVLTLRRRIPDERQEDTASAVLQLLADRLRDAGMLPRA
jgi:hypothetical protein